MTTLLEKILEETLSDINTLSQEKVKELLKEALRTFTELKNMSHSTDPAEREQAYKEAMSLKEAIQKQTEEISRQAGLDPSFFNTLIQSPNFNPNKWVELSTAKEELEALRSEVGSRLKKHSNALPKKKKGDWIPG